MGSAWEARVPKLEIISWKSDLLAHTSNRPRLQLRPELLRKSGTTRLYEMNYYVHRKGGGLTARIRRDASATYDHNPLSSRKYLSQRSKTFSLAGEMAARGKLAYVKVIWASCVLRAPATYGCWLIARFVSSRLTLGELCSTLISSHDAPGSRWMCGRVLKKVRY